MWPDDYIDWARRARPTLTGQLQAQVKRRLSEQAQSIINIGDLVQQATGDAFDLAYGHSRHPNYFAQETEFRVWLMIIGFREAARLLLRHEEVEPWLQRLPADQRRLLGMVYLDRLPAGDVAAFLGMPAVEVAARAQETLDLFLQAVRPEQEREE